MINIKSPEDYGCNLHINKPAQFDPRYPVSLDVETDEADHFVGLAMCQSDKDVYYWGQDQWCDEFADFLGSFKYITQGGAFDIAMIKKWGVVKVSYDSIEFDTKIMAYTMDTTLKFYGLKSLAKKYLNMEWSTYKEMVGVGQKKVTLDKQPVERVAPYCGMDALATFKLQGYLLRHMTDAQRHYFDTIEMPVYRILSQMEEKGIYLDVPYLTKFDTELGKQIDKWDRVLKEYGGFNPRSPKQLLEFLNKSDIHVKNTNVNTLTEWKSHPIIRDLLKYRHYNKLKSTYTQPFLKSFSLPRLYGRFLQHTITGRLSSAKPNFQNIPTKTEDGKKIRRAIIAPPGYKLLILDYSQIEYRLFAHFTQDPTLLEAYKNGENIHQRTGSIVGGDKSIGKTINFAAIYGAQSKKIAQIASISESRADEMLSNYWKALPIAALWISKVKWLVKKQGGIKTLMGRFIPLPEIHSKNPYERMRVERQAVNYIIQGSAAEVVKLAMIEIHKQLSMVANLQVHDELVFEVVEQDVLPIKLDIKHIMETCVNISASLEVTAVIGDTWADGKE